MLNHIGNIISSTQDASQGDSGGPLVGHFHHQITPIDLNPVHNGADYAVDNNGEKESATTGNLLVLRKPEFSENNDNKVSKLEFDQIALTAVDPNLNRLEGFTDAAGPLQSTAQHEGGETTRPNTLQQTTTVDELNQAHSERLKRHTKSPETQQAHISRIRHKIADDLTKNLKTEVTMGNDEKINTSADEMLNASTNEQDYESLKAAAKDILSQHFKRSTNDDNQYPIGENKLPVFNSANKIVTKSYAANQDIEIENHNGKSDIERTGKTGQVQRKLWENPDYRHPTNPEEKEEVETITMTKNELHQIIAELLHKEKALDQKTINSRKHNLLYLNANDRHQKTRDPFHSHKSFTSKAESRKEDYKRYVYRTFNIEQPTMPWEDILDDKYDTFTGGSRVQSAQMNKFIDRIAHRLQHYKQEQAESRKSKSDDNQASIKGYGETEAHQRKGNLVDISKYLRSQSPPSSHGRHNHKFMDFENMVVENDKDENAKHRMLSSDDPVPRTKNIGRFLWPPFAADGGGGKTTPLQSMINAGIEASILSALQHFQQLQQQQHKLSQAQQLVGNTLNGIPANHDDKTQKVITLNYVISVI